ncbi:MAG: NosD domain-containing protein, partial [Candidatus Thermoplasmatota archaeon]|nr:NosD domain-containing protein [Candidatus Thermoplasmatota archaeon]
GASSTLTRELLVANIYVDDDADPAWYDARHVRTIQEGVANASNGHFIYVLPGTYTENVVVNKQVTITGMQAVLDAAGSGDALTVTAHRAYIHHLTVTNASHGRGVVIDGDNVTVMHCTLTDHKIALVVNGDHALFAHNTVMGYGVGRGAVVAGSHTHMDSNYFNHLQNATQVVGGTENVIVGNHYAGNVFALQVTSASGTCITDNYFSSGNSYGIDIVGDTWCTLDNNTFRDNGEALRVFSSGLVIVNHTFEGNTLGLGIYADGTTVRNCVFQDNHQAVQVDGAYNTMVADCVFSESRQGVIVQEAATVDLRNLTFADQEGASLSIQDSAQVTVFQCSFTGNGEAAYVHQSSDLHLRECWFDHQQAGVVISDSQTIIHDCTFAHVEMAIEISGVQVCTVTDVVVHNATRGIELHGASHVVEGCDIRHATYGIYATDAAGLVISATLHHNTYGLYMVNITGAIVQGAAVHNNTYGVYLHHGQDNVLAATALRDNDKGAVLVNTSGNTLQSATLTGNRLGVEATGSHHTTIVDSSFVSNYEGLVLYQSPHTTVEDVAFADNDYGIDVEGSTPNHFIQHMRDSTVNGKPVFYVLNQSPVHLADASYGYLGLVNCRQVSVTNISTQPNGEGMLLVNATDVAVADSRFSGHLDGMVWMYVQDGVIETTEVSGNARDGIIFTSSSSLAVSHCQVSANAQRGINAYSIAAEDGRLVVSNCTLSDNWLGVNVENIHHNTFARNTITGNQKAGLRFFASPHNTLTDNYLSGNGDGIIIRQSTSLTLVDQVLEDNTRDIYLSDSQDVHIQRCTFALSPTGLETDASTAEVDNSSFSGHVHAASLTDSTITFVHVHFSSSTYGVHALSSLVTVRDCMVSGNTYGLYLFQSDGSAVTACLSPGIANNTYGLVVNQSHQVTVTDAVMAENEHALVIHSSLDVRVDNVTACNNTYGFIFTGATARALLSSSLLHHNLYALDIEAHNNTVVNCSLWRNMYGVRILSGDNNTLYHNNFAFNWYQAQDRGSNTWDGGYPVGGNYWSDYAGTDAYRGPGQNLSGSDHLGDMPYPIAKGLNRDRYPLMHLNVNSSPIPNDPPAARFSVYPRQPFSGDQILFMDQSTDPNGDLDIVSWHWDFGDGNSSGQQHPQHAYEVSGTYTVSLTVEDRDGLQSTYTLTLAVANVPPTAHFTYAPAAPTTGQSIRFTDASTDLDGDIVNWSWDFGDGGTSQARNATHTYQQPGIKTVVLTVTDDRGSTAIISRQIEVANARPTAQFFFVPEEPRAGEAINFTDVSSDDGDVVSWHWDFGDGTASDVQNPRHVYEEKGTYNVTLTVKDNHGGEHTTTQTITVKARSDTPGFTLLLVLGAAMVAVTLASRKRKREKL